MNKTNIGILEAMRQGLKEPTSFDKDNFDKEYPHCVIGELKRVAPGLVVYQDNSPFRDALMRLGFTRKDANLCNEGPERNKTFTHGRALAMIRRAIKANKGGK